MDYSAGHKWIDFQVDLKAAAPQFWLLLGEAQARCSQISGSPLRPEAAREIGRIQKARFLLASAAIAGNTITDDEENRQGDRRLDLAPAQRPIPPSVTGLDAAWERLLPAAAVGGTAEVTPDLLRELNRLILGGTGPGAWRSDGALPPPDGGDPGPPAKDVVPLSTSLGTWLSAPRPGPPVVVGLMRAFLAHLYMAWIRPFAAANALTARALELHVLAHAGVPEPALGIAAVHQARDRDEHLRQIERAKRSASGPVNFIQYAVQGFVEELRALQETIVARQSEAAWGDHVAAAFLERSGKTARRQRQLLLDLGAVSGPVPTARIRVAGPDTALAYAGLNEKTVRRDLAELHSRGLVERVRGGWRARREATAPWRTAPAPPG